MLALYPFQRLVIADAVKLPEPFPHLIDVGDLALNDPFDLLASPREIRFDLEGDAGKAKKGSTNDDGTDGYVSQLSGTSAGMS